MSKAPFERFSEQVDELVAQAESSSDRTLQESVQSLVDFRNQFSSLEQEARSILLAEQETERQRRLNNTGQQGA